MKDEKVNMMTAILTVALVLMATLPSFPSPVYAQLPPGIPRGDLVIFRTEITSKVPDDMNFWKPANPNIAGGGSPIFEPIWYLNVVEMKLVPVLASAPPEYSENFTVMRIRVRPGVYWNDGVEFTADDIVFTLKLHLNVTGLANSASTQIWVEDAYAEDAYTAIIKLKKPNPKFHMTFTNVMGLTGFLIMPKHIWEKVEDPLTFKFNPPVGTGPYILDTYDPNGYWCLFRRRDDWERSATSKVFGKPKPKYVLRIHYTPDDPKQIIAISRHEMDITELTMELWDTARSANPYLEAFWKDFPYVWQYGICDHGPSFNLAKYPYNITDVRWALALAINRTEVNIIALDAKGRIATFTSLSVPYLQKHYVSRLLPWIKNFTLPDGYKPFDETVPYKLADYAKSKGYTLTSDPTEIWGLGWWKYDPEEAAKLLKKHGFYKDDQGRWHLPTGELWTLDLVIPAYHVLASRLGFATAEQWRKFGIDVVDEALTSGVFSSRINIGDFDVFISHGQVFCSAHVDTWQWWQGLHIKYVKPLGTVATSNQIRWNSSRFSELLDELSLITPEDPKVIDIVSEMAKVIFEEMPAINYFLGSKLIVRDTYVWRGWPTADNWYWEESHWNVMWCIPILVKLEPTGNVPTSEMPIISPPTTPTISPELNATIAGIASGIAALQSDLAAVKTDMADLSNSISSLSGGVNSIAGQISFLNTVVAVEAIVIVILAVGLIYSIKRKS